jgi:hypothetical protein
MQKQPPSSSSSAGSKASGSISKPAASASGNIQKTPPQPMVTAQERLERKEARWSAPAPSTPSTPAPVTGAAPAAVDPIQLEIDRFGALQNDLMLTSIKGDIEDIDSAVAALPANVANIRARGYVFKSYLEKKVETLATQWQGLRANVVQTVETQGRQLQADANSVQAALNMRRSAGAALSTLESKVHAATSSLRGMYDTLDGNVNQTQQQIDDVSWTLQQAEQASFGFLPTEAPVEAVPANWKAPGDKDGVEGVLYLTDQRLLFEQKEEVATKKVLFITTEKQKVQALNWYIPVSQIDKATGSKKGFMGKDDFLTVSCSADAAFLDAQGNTAYVPGVGGKMAAMEIHLKGETGEAWQGFVGRVKSQEIAKERTVPVDAAAVEAAASAPTKCPTCGATLSQTVMRGQTEIKCEFCGSVVRL